MPSAAQDFARLQRLPPAGAIAYLQGRKDLTVTHDWEDLWQAEHARQFTVSRLTRLDLLQAVRDGITQSVNGDLSRADWMRDTRKLLQQAGWWGTKTVTDPETGKAVRTTFDNARLKLIFDVNTRQAAAAGQWARIQATKKTHPYLRYVTMDDDRVRPAHAAWQNLVLPVDDKFWQTHMPPNGWGCRCRVVAVNQRDYDKGKSPGGAPFNTKPPSAETIEHVNRRTGEVTKTPAGIDPGFDYNPGEAASEARADFEQITRDKLARADAALAKAAKVAGLEAPTVAREVPDQPDWKTLGLADLRAMGAGSEAPEMLPPASTLDGAVSQLRGTLGVPAGGARSVRTPVGDVTILDELLEHVVAKRRDARERYANFVLPTLAKPDEVWNTDYDDATKRKRFIKLFSGSKYDIMIVVYQDARGELLWNVINRDRKRMNLLRVGDLIYRPGK